MFRRTPYLFRYVPKYLFYPPILTLALSFVGITMFLVIQLFGVDYNQHEAAARQALAYILFGLAVFLITVPGMLVTYENIRRWQAGEKLIYLKPYSSTSEHTGGVAALLFLIFLDLAYALIGVFLGYMAVRLLRSLADLPPTL